MLPKKEPQRRCPQKCARWLLPKSQGSKQPLRTLLSTTSKRRQVWRLHWSAPNVICPPVDKPIADSMAFIEGAKKRVAAESAKILEVEKMRRICQDELEHAEKELQEVREEAESRRRLASSRSIKIQWQSSKRSCPGSEHKWSSCRVPVRTQKFHVDPNVKRPCLSGQGRVELSAWLSERHSDLG